MRVKRHLKSAILNEVLELRVQLKEAQDMLGAIRAGEADALVIESDAGAKVYTLEGQDAETNRIRSEMLSQVSDAVIAVDDNDCVTYLNAAAERLYGFSSSSALGRALSEIYKTKWLNSEDEAAAANAMLKRSEWHGGSIHVRKDGRELNIETSITALKGNNLHAGGRLAVVRDVTERKQNDLKLLVSEIRYRRLFEAANDGILLLDPSTRKIIDANPFILELLGYRRDQLVGKELYEIGLLKDEAASQEMFRNLQSAGEVRYENLPFETNAGQNQEVEVVANLYEEDGWPVIQCNIRDITDRKRSEEHVKMLIAEVNHRAKNLLAVVLAIERQTNKHGDPTTFIDRLSDRIDALATSQDLLVNSQWQGVEIADLVAAQLAHFNDLIGTRVLIEGAVGLTLNMLAAQGIGMALHELATNAAKYGALSDHAGKVRISWAIQPGAIPSFMIRWQEEGGPNVEPPVRKGFGHIVTGRMVEVAVKGRAEIAFLANGLSWSLSASPENMFVSSKPENLLRLPKDAQ